MALVIAIDFDLAAEHGANAAIVHQQIAWWIQHPSTQEDAHAPGWFTGSAEDLAELCPFSVDAVRRAVKKLVDAGLLEKAKHRANQGDHTLSYRPVDNPVDTDGEIANSGSGDAAESRSGGIAESTSLREVEKTPPTPPCPQTQGGTAENGEGWEQFKQEQTSEQVRTTTAAITRALGLTNEHRTALTPIVADALQHLSAQAIYDRTTQGTMQGVRDPIAVVAARLRPATPKAAAR